MLHTATHSDAPVSSHSPSLASKRLMEPLYKRYRALRKRLEKMERCEELIRCNRQAELNEDQLKSLERKSEVVLLFDEVHSIIEQIERVLEEEEEEEVPAVDIETSCEPDENPKSMTETSSILPEDPSPSESSLAHSSPIESPLPEPQTSPASCDANQIEGAVDLLRGLCRFDLQCGSTSNTLRERILSFRNAIAPADKATAQKHLELYVANSNALVDGIHSYCDVSEAISQILRFAPKPARATHSEKQLQTSRSSSSRRGGVGHPRGEASPMSRVENGVHRTRRNGTSRGPRHPPSEGSEATAEK
jgi:hypothetical protein